MIGVCVSRRRQSNGAAGAPAPEFRNGSYDFDSLANDRSDNLVESDIDARSNGTGCACCACGAGGAGAYRCGYRARARRLHARRLASSRSIDGNVSAGQVDLAGLERVPAQGQQCVGRVDVGDLDLLGHGVASGDGSIA